MLFEKGRDIFIERRRIFQTARMSRARYQSMLRAGDSRAHLLAAFQRVVELAVHDQIVAGLFQLDAKQIARLKEVLVPK